MAVVREVLGDGEILEQVEALEDDADVRNSMAEYLASHGFEVDAAEGGDAMRAALADARCAPQAIDFISAHGTGTVYNDAMEMAAISAVILVIATRLPTRASS